MSPAERFWAKVHRRALRLTPVQMKAYLKAEAALKASLSAPEVEQLIASGSAEQVIQLALTDPDIAMAFAPFRAQMQLTTRDAVAWFASDIPGVPKQLEVTFDALNPRVIDAVKRMDTAMMRGLADDVRGTVRLVIQTGLENGWNPRETAKYLRGVIGLAPNQVAAVNNYRAKLEAGESVTSYALRDKRFGTPTTPAQIDKAVEAYQRRMLGYAAETNARTATLDALKLGQRLSWQDAQDKGFVPEGSLVKQWKGVMDDREREEHIAMEGETVPFDQPYSNGEMEPGESTYNCRCLSIIHVDPARILVAA